jgi:hypothetical protein
VWNTLGASLDSTQLDVLQQIISGISDTVEQITSRRFARELVTERFGLNDIDLGDFNGAVGAAPYRIMLSRRPILHVEEVRYNGDTIDTTNLKIEEPDAGFLFNRDGFTPTSLWFQQISRVRTGYTEPLWEIDYSAGYVLPSFETVSETITAVDATTNTLSIASEKLLNGDTVRFVSTGSLPAPLSSNRDYFVRDGQSDGTFSVTDEAGGAAIDLSDEGSGSHTVMRQVTLPKSLQNDVNLAVINEFKGRKRDRNLFEEKLGEYTARYNIGQASNPTYGTSSYGLPPEIEQRLMRWKDWV